MLQRGRQRCNRMVATARRQSWPQKGEIRFQTDESAARVPAGGLLALREFRRFGRRHEHEMAFDNRRGNLAELPPLVL